VAILEPVVIVARSDDVAFLREVFADLPPLGINPTAMRLNGWTDESLMFGRVLGSLCDLIRSGDIEFGTTNEENHYVQ
jgi:hypothetical protein